MEHFHDRDRSNSSQPGKMKLAIPRRSLPPVASSAQRSNHNHCSSNNSLPTIPRMSSGAPPASTTGEAAGSKSSGWSLSSVPRKTSFAASRPAPSLSSVPRKSSQPAQAGAPNGPPGSGSNRAPSSQTRKRSPPHSFPTSSLVDVISEVPLVLRIKTKGMDWESDSNSRAIRSSERAPKRKRVTYQEFADSDPEELFLTDSDDDNVADNSSSLKKGSRLKKIKTTAASSAPPSTPNQSTSSADIDASLLSGVPNGDGTKLDVVMTEAGTGGDSVEAPPPGVLSSLWYSREQVLHVWVIDKILSWRTRPTVKLEWKDPNAVKCLDSKQAALISSQALADKSISLNQRKRQEMSRLNPSQCPMVMTMAAKKEEVDAQSRGEEPRFKVMAPPADTPPPREEVLLVKWRGKSYMHCSWERKKDLESMDMSNNTARNKIKRYFQSQEIALGKQWRHIMESERGNNSTGAQVRTEEGAVQQATETGDEFFPASHLEVERILACDESEMNLQIFAKQRALNMQEEHRAAQRQDREVESKTRKQEDVLENLPLIKDPKDEKQQDKDSKDEKQQDKWDPEDYVRYVVKWKDLQYSEMTWEYWKDIKRDAVEQAEDFWYRQKSPSIAEATEIKSKPHPHMRQFRKLTESPVFGVSKRPRPVADLGNGIQEEKETVQPFRLRNYQLEGVNWLLFNWWNKRSCILADEMGLGKTIQSVTFLQQLMTLEASQVRGPFLIVAPLSLIVQWQNETHTWAPDMNVVFYHGSADSRDFLVQQEFYYTDQFIPKADAVKLKKLFITKFHILITTYEVVLKDIAVLSKVKWKALLVDEAHRLKNPKARLFEELMSVPREFCLLLTGTPLQNSTEELWALLHFSDPVAFASKDDFVEKFGQLNDAKQVSELHAVLKPYLLRRVKEDVEKALPPKEETILEVSLTPIQKQYYKAIYEKNTTFLFKGAKPSNAPSLMNAAMELRKCCNHPFLIRGAEERILADAAAAVAMTKKEKDEGGDDDPADNKKLFVDQLIKSSGKLVLLSKLLPKLFDGGHKVLIFSQMVRALDLLEELVKLMKYKYERLDGATTASSRAAAVARFNKKSCERFVMLLSTRAGGLGLNLTAADTIVINDSDWNPQNDLQAMARAHRIGQTRAVRVYRLLTAKTYEMHMFHSASMKLGLDRAVLAHQRQQEGDESGSSKSKGKSDKEAQAKEIDELLKKGAYDVFKDDGDEEAKKFMDTDIDSLLAQSSTSVTYGNTASSSLSSGLGSFSKASFVADTGDGTKDVDLDDPNFWEKAIGLDAPVDTPEEIENMLDDGVKRHRRQVQQYDPYAAFAEAEQKKKDKIAMKLKEEKEEKERLRLEKKLKKIEENEKRKREREAEIRERSKEKEEKVKAKANKFMKEKVKVKLKPLKPRSEETPPKDMKPKKPKKPTKSRAARLAEFEDPVLERLRQAWEVPQRNRASSAILRFGFGRFSKIRHESNLTSLPLQDLEVFAREYVYIIALQVAVFLLEWTRSRVAEASLLEDSLVKQVRPILATWLGSYSSNELDWLCDSTLTALNMYLEVDKGARLLRVPMSLAEPDYIEELRKGSALRALRRIGILCRLNSIVEHAVDEILSNVGYDERGRRGCIAKDLDTLDGDLKARHLSSEELLLAVSEQIVSCSFQNCDGLVSWWDRSCDVALLVGTYIHGFGNYEAMKSDEDLPFANKIAFCASRDMGCMKASLAFEAGCNSAREVFDAALESAKFKSQKEAHAAVAAAVANSKKSIDQRKATETNDVYCIDTDKDDSHMITLSRLGTTIVKTIRNGLKISSAKVKEDVGIKPKKKDANKKDHREQKSEGSSRVAFLPMPDGPFLDSRVVQLVDAIGAQEDPYHRLETGGDEGWDITNDCAVHQRILSRCISQLGIRAVKNTGIGYSGTQCGTSHRSLDDGSDFAVGPASSELAHVAYGSDAPRYLRAIGVPINITRYGVLSLVYAEKQTLDIMLSVDRQRYNPQSLPPREKVDDSSKSATQSQRNGTTNAVVEASVVVHKDATEGRVEKESGVDTLPTVVVKEDASTIAGLSSPSDSVFAIAEPFKENAAVRAALCTVALHYGYIHCDRAMTVHPDITSRLNEVVSDHIEDNRSMELFSSDSFRILAQEFMDSRKLPPPSAIQEYIEQSLLPHCLKLCLSGNGPTTWNARGSKGKYETPFGISHYQEPTAKRKLPLPDPTQPVAEHSIEAISRAATILRRIRLIKTAQYLVAKTLNEDETKDTATSSRHSRLSEVLDKSEMVSRSESGLPMWWSSPLHDIGLLVFAATKGVLSICKEKLRCGTVFDRSVLEQLLLRRLAIAAPKSAQSPQMKTWAQDQISHSFPSAYVLERRLSVLCFEATNHLPTMDENRYDHLPMFDHGAWPRNF